VLRRLRRRAGAFIFIQELPTKVYHSAHGEAHTPTAGRLTRARARGRRRAR